VTDALLRAALAGTAREPMPSAGAALDALVPREASAEQRLLLLAGARAVARRAGFRPPALPLPEPAPEDALPVCSPKAAELISWFLSAEEHDLLLEAFKALRAARQRLRPELLPAALSLRDEELREALLPVLGARGAWLGKLREDWSWAAGVAPAETTDLLVWEVGSHAERFALLRSLRAQRPDAARQLLESTWKNEKADRRALFLTALQIGLSAADESFLEAALDDRSVDVRALTPRLLARLPGSALTRRMESRAATLLRAAPEASRLEVSLPAELDAAWERDGVLRKPPQGMGARSFWLIQTLSLIRPQFWEQQLGQDPADVAAGADEDLLQGLTGAVLLFEDARWAAALFDALLAAPKSDFQRAGLRELLPLLEPAEAGKRLEQLLKKPHEALPAVEAMAALPAPWSDQLSLQVARALPGGGWDLLALAVMRASPKAFAAMENVLPPFDEQPSNQRLLDRARETLRLRGSLHQELHP
jgi:hypothetical protein